MACNCPAKYAIMTRDSLREEALTFELFASFSQIIHPFQNLGIRSLVPMWRLQEGEGGVNGSSKWWGEWGRGWVRGKGGRERRRDRRENKTKNVKQLNLTDNSETHWAGRCRGRAPGNEIVLCFLSSMGIILKHAKAPNILIHPNSASASHCPPTTHNSLPGHLLYQWRWTRW